MKILTRRTRRLCGDHSGFLPERLERLEYLELLERPQSGLQ